MLNRFQTIGLVAVLFASFSIALNASGECDDTAAGTDVGDCKSGLTACAGLSNVKCLDLRTKKHIWFEDFPEDCVQQNDKNCNTPGKDCWNFQTCQWINGACEGSGDPVSWFSAAKRETVDCVLNCDPQ